MESKQLFEILSKNFNFDLREAMDVKRYSDPKVNYSLLS